MRTERPEHQRWIERTGGGCRLRSDFAQHVAERRRQNPYYTPNFPVLFGEKEGKIARANRGRDPLYLFSALQRQLGYPEVPRPRRPDEAEARIALLELRVTQLESRLKSAELFEDGATALGMEPTFYWDSLTDDALDWIKANTTVAYRVI